LEHTYKKLGNQIALTASNYTIDPKTKQIKLFVNFTNQGLSDMKQWEHTVELSNNNTIGASLVQTGAKNEMKVPLLKARETKTLEFNLNTNDQF